MNVLLRASSSSCECHDRTPLVLSPALPADAFTTHSHSDLVFVGVIHILVSIGLRHFCLSTPPLSCVECCEGARAASDGRSASQGHHC